MTTIQTQQSSIVGLGELAVSKDASMVLTCIGLGSCIALCVYDPTTRIGGMAHLMLPGGKEMIDKSNCPTKYVECGTMILLQRMIKQGAKRSEMVVKLVGGAKMLSIPGDNYRLDIGNRNIADVKTVLARENLPIRGSELGGTVGRTAHLFIDTGKVTVKSVSGQVSEL